MNDFKNLNVLVTGATGFIGSNLVRVLLQKGAKVSILKRPKSSVWRLKDILTRIKILEADLRDKHHLQLALKNSHSRAIFHLAACVKREPSSSLIKENLETNVWGTTNLIDCVTKGDIKSFVNTGTCDEYGDNPVPFNEKQRENPLSPYAASKVAASHYCQMLTRTTGLPIITLRPFLTYGPYQTGEMLIPDVVTSCLKSLPIQATLGQQTREFHYISDIVNGFLLAATNKKAIGEIIDLGTGEEHTVKEVIEMIVELTEYRLKWKLGNLPYRENEMFRFYCQGDKAKKLLKWRPKTSLKDGLIKTIDWQKKFSKSNKI
ncbi:MAG: GDP-mannose 4,6-dehydratase [Candidatus Levybacteria bacterium]|nr:GDP-mannose 4,6-dehydratase [Candidatus Levybacteria bacterium]